MAFCGQGSGRSLELDVWGGTIRDYLAFNADEDAKALKVRITVCLRILLKRILLMLKCRHSIRFAKTRPSLGQEPLFSDSLSLWIPN